MKKINQLIIIVLQLSFFNCLGCKIGREDLQKISRVSKNISTENISVELKLLTSFKTGESDFFKTVNEYPISTFLYKQELFLLNYSDEKLIVIDIKKKSTSTSAKINEIIKTYKNEIITQ
jgi:hypothetical protein